jgi:hypothetical protein
MNIRICEKGSPEKGFFKRKKYIAGNVQKNSNLFKFHHFHYPILSN